MPFLEMIANEAGGGSVGDPQMASVPVPANLATLREMYEVNFDYDACHNRFFRTLLKGKLVADYGCGYGFSTFYISYNCTVIGFDVDCQGIDYANRLRDRFGARNVKFICHKPYETCYPEEYFDAVVSSDVIEHVQNPLLYLAEANRILRAGGTLCLSTPNGLIAGGDSSIIKAHSKFHIYEYSPKELQEMLHASGFIIHRVFRQFLPSNRFSPFRRQNYQGNSHNGSLLHNSFRRQYALFSAISMGGGLRYPMYTKLRKLVKKLAPPVNYHIAPVALEQISSENCDCILIIAINSS